MLLFKKSKKDKPRKFTTPEGVLVTVTIGKPGETLFPEKLAEANEHLAKMEAMSILVKDLFERTENQLKRDRY